MLPDGEWRKLSDADFVYVMNILVALKRAVGFLQKDYRIRDGWLANMCNFIRSLLFVVSPHKSQVNRP